MANTEYTSSREVFFGGNKKINARLKDEQAESGIPTLFFLF